MQIKQIKAIYGLKISSKKWNKKFSEEICKLNMENEVNKPCLLPYRKQGRLAFVMTYVGDILIGGNTQRKLTKLKIV